jgi:hypothetical protein
MEAYLFLPAVVEQDPRIRRHLLPHVYFLANANRLGTAPGRNADPLEGQPPITTN